MQSQARAACRAPSSRPAPHAARGHAGLLGHAPHGLPLPRRRLSGPFSPSPCRSIPQTHPQLLRSPPALLPRSPLAWSLPPARLHFAQQEELPVREGPPFLQLGGVSRLPRAPTPQGPCQSPGSPPSVTSYRLPRPLRGPPPEAQGIRGLDQSGTFGYVSAQTLSSQILLLSACSLQLLSGPYHPACVSCFHSIVSFCLRRYYRSLRPNSNGTSSVKSPSPLGRKRSVLRLVCVPQAWRVPGLSQLCVYTAGAHWAGGRWWLVRPCH